jgi:uncharacterized membrane protein
MASLSQRRKTAMTPRSDRVAQFYPFAGLVVAVVCVAAGVGLSLMNATGHTVWEGSFMTARLRVDTTAPGVICFVVAVVIVYLSRPRRSR